MAGCGRPLSDSNLVTKGEAMSELGCSAEWWDLHIAPYIFPAKSSRWPRFVWGEILALARPRLNALQLPPKARADVKRRSGDWV
jgi:hypothetical protein